jgi:hypothetical protein
MDGNVVVGLLWMVAIAVAPVVAVSLLVRVNLLYEACVTLGRRVYLLHTPEPRLGPPLEKLASDLRRLRPDARMPRPGTPTARLNRSLASYDVALMATARALEIPTTLDEIPDGFDREVERRRLERALTSAGLNWQEQEH